MDKMTQTEITLRLLKANGHEGVSPLNFSTGFRLGAYIHILRKNGWDITTDTTRFKGSQMATYILN